MNKFAFKAVKRSRKPFFIEEEDIFSGLIDKTGSSLFLGKYTQNEVKAILAKKGFYKEAKKKGLWPLILHIAPTERPPVQRFQIFYKSSDPSNMLVDLKIKDGVFFPEDRTALNVPGDGFRFLIMEWLTMQNPLKSFSAGRKPLPGQTHPGLGIGRKAIDLFVYLAQVNRNDGVLAFPAYLHNALIFSSRFFLL